MSLGKIPGKHNPFASSEVVALADFTVDAESSNERTVSIQLKNANGKVLYAPTVVPYYLSDAATGIGITGTAATTLAGAVAAQHIPLTTGKSGRLISDATGAVGLSITYTGGAKTWYLVLIMPDGSLVVSEAIAFT